jgi:hypothetical protein
VVNFHHSGDPKKKGGRSSYKGSFGEKSPIKKASYFKEWFLETTELRP